MSGIFDGLNDAKPSAGGVYFEPGTYTVEVLECKAGTTRKKVKFFAVDCKILESSNPNRPAGTSASWFVKIEEDTPALANIREFLSIAFNVPIEEVDEASGEMVIAEQQPLAGTVLALGVVQIITKKNKQPFNVHTWELANKAA